MLYPIFFNIIIGCFEFSKVVDMKNGPIYSPDITAAHLGLSGVAGVASFLTYVHRIGEI